MNDAQLLTTRQMAEFAARGVLRLEAVVPAVLNERFLADVGDTDVGNIQNVLTHYAGIMAGSVIPVLPAGTPLRDAYPADSAVAHMLRLPAIAGAIQSLVGANPTFDHHFLHITFPPQFYAASGEPQVAQPYHQDSTIDPRQAFDIQLMYFPHDVTPEMGGTRYLPGSHLRIVSEAAIARYQNIRGQVHEVCPAGTVLILHHGIWHGGGLNQSDRLRYMFKIRLNPTRRQCLLWDTQDLPATQAQRPIFWTGMRDHPDWLSATLTRSERWFEADTGRLEYINRVRFWRYLCGDERFDADYWVSRIENEPDRAAEGVDSAS